MSLVFLLLAGPNGSGKSTLARSDQFKKFGLNFINPDDVARAAPPNSNPLIWSGREVRRLINEKIASGESFSVETTLSGNNHLQTIDACRNAGYAVEMHFVFVTNIQASKGRVRARVGMGGHDVPESDQERRYTRSLANSIEILPLLDHAFFYDNSGRDAHRLVARFEAGTATFLSPDAPAWLRGAADDAKGAS